MVRVIFKTLFGSHLYGLDTPASDKDYKAIAVPDGESILLQKAFKTKNETTKPRDQIKNTSLDSDTEVFALHEFLKLCFEGQTVALDMLFSPEAFWLESSDEWRFLVANRQKLLHRDMTAFVGYCQHQAAKYGIKGSRVAAAKHALSVFQSYEGRKDSHGGPLRLTHVWPEIVEKLSNVDHIKFVVCKTPVGDLHLKECPSVQVCDRIIQSGVAFKLASEIVGRIVDKYGQRALQAETNKGIDWKAVSHAFRVAEECVELVETRHITFPIRNREYILQVKTGQRQYVDVAPVLEQKVAEVLEKARNSNLPDKLDSNFWTKWLCDIYRKEVLK